MRAAWIFVISILLASCVGTSLETDADNPANASARPAPAQSAPVSLQPTFDPFVTYGVDTASASAGEREHNGQHDETMTPSNAPSPSAIPPSSSAAPNPSSSSSSAPSTPTTSPASHEASATKNASPKPKPGEPKEAAPSPPSAAIVYTCPMHPQIVRDAPGKCPICGMDLVPQKPGTGAAAH